MHLNYKFDHFISFTAICQYDIVHDGILKSRDNVSTESSHSL